MKNLAFIILFACTCVRAAVIEIKPGDNIQSAMNAAGQNGTLRLTLPGKYTSSTRLRPPAGLTIKGTTTITRTFVMTQVISMGKTYSVPSATYNVENPSVISVNGDHAIQAVENLRVNNVSFDGSVLWQDGAVTRGITFDNFTVDTVQINGGHRTLFEFQNVTGIFRNFIVRDSNRIGEAFWYGYGGNLLFEYGIVDGGNDGMHLTLGSINDTFLAQQILFSGQKRMPVEYQKAGSNAKVLDCWLHKPFVQATTIPKGNRQPENPNDGLLGFSMPADESSGAQMKGCVIINFERPSEPGGGIGMRMGAEQSSKNFNVEGNVILGTNHVVAVTNSAATGKIAGNHFEGFIQSPGPNNGGKVVIDNNNNPALRDKLLARGMPGPNYDFNVAPPTTRPDWKVTILPVTVDGRIQVTMVEMPVAATSYVIDVKSTTISERGPQVGPANVKFSPGAILSGYHPGWQLDFQVTAFSTAGSQVAVAPWQTVNMPGDPTVQWPTTAPSPSPSPILDTGTISIDRGSGLGTVQLSR